MIQVLYRHYHLYALKERKSLTMIFGTSLKRFDLLLHIYQFKEKSTFKNNNTNFIIKKYQS
jgi:hypothetical protein